MSPLHIFMGCFRNSRGYIFKRHTVKTRITNLFDTIAEFSFIRFLFWKWIWRQRDIFVDVVGERTAFLYTSHTNSTNLRAIPVHMKLLLLSTRRALKLKLLIRLPWMKTSRRVSRAIEYCVALRVQKPIARYNEANAWFWKVNQSTIVKAQWFSLLAPLPETYLFATDYWKHFNVSIVLRILLSISPPANLFIFHYLSLSLLFILRPNLWISLPRIDLFIFHYTIPFLITIVV